MPGVRPGALLGHTPGLWTPPAFAAAPAFNPATLPNLAAWYKADAGTSTTTDGVGISQWNDQSGNGRHLTQATAGLQPLYKATIQNGLPVVRCDGVDDFLRATFALAQPYYYFIVGAWRTAYVSNSMMVDGSGSLFGAIFRTASTGVSIYAGTTADTNTTTPQAWHSYGGLFSSTSSELRTDGGTAVVGDAGNNAAGGITVGADGTNAQAGAVDVGELIVLSAAPSAGNRVLTEGYLRRWGTP